VSAMKNIATRAGRAAVLAATTVGLTVGLATAPASAAPPQSGGNVTIAHSSGQGASAMFKVTVQGVFAMSEHDAHGFMNNLGTGTRMARGLGAGGVYVEVIGDDSGSNDQLLRSSAFYPGKSLGTDPGGWLYAASDGIHFRRDVYVPASVLNEDNGFWDKTDEIYGVAVFVDGDSGIRRAYATSLAASSEQTVMRAAFPPASPSTPRRPSCPQPQRERRR